MVYFPLVDRRTTRPHAAGVAAYSRALRGGQLDHAASVAGGVIGYHYVAGLNRRARAKGAFCARGAGSGFF